MIRFALLYFCNAIGRAFPQGRCFHPLSLGFKMNICGTAAPGNLCLYGKPIKMAHGRTQILLHGNSSLIQHEKAHNEKQQPSDSVLYIPHSSALQRQIFNSLLFLLVIISVFLNNMLILLLLIYWI